jgi:hypothetical protein
VPELEDILAGGDRRPNSATFATLFTKFSVNTTGITSWQVEETYWSLFGRWQELSGHFLAGSRHLVATSWQVAET